MEILSLVLSLLVFASIGFYLQSGFKLSPTFLTLFSLGCGFIVVSSIGVNTRLISMWGVSIFLNHSLLGLLMGVSARVLIRFWKSRKVSL
jgi:hypothetical protein